MTQWWQQRPMRLVQTNLREIDVTADPDRFVESLKEFSANVVLFNAGGIVANYPTSLPFHYRNPHLTGDFLGEVMERVQAAGIRLIARFDFSKVNESIASAHPDWHYRSFKGESVTYNGQVHCCLNGAYQQEHSLEILAEAASRYPIDGVFINMHGYEVRDYSRVVHGFCQCDNCARRFAEEGAGALPRSLDDPSYPAYLKFQARTVAELFQRRAAVVKDIRPSIATCNYTPSGTDIHRLESGTQMADGIPDFTYSASHHVKMVTDTFAGMAVSNAAVHFVDFPIRHAAVSPHLTSLRLAQDAVHGGWLDFYVLGTLDGQPDRRCFDQVRELYAFHAEHERYYTGTRPVSDVCLVQPPSRGRDSKEFLGVYRILAENHVQFDVISAKEATRERLRGYAAVIVPAAGIDIDTDRPVLRTGTTSTVPIQGAYFAIRPDDKKTLTGLDDLDLVYLYGAFEPIEREGDGYLAYIPPHMFGPPEKCYYTEVTDIPGMVRTPDGDVVIPWNLGTHYEEYAHDGHARLVLAALRDLLAVKPSLTTDAPATVEVSTRDNPGAGCRLVNLVNVTGQLGTAFHAPVPVRDITVHLTLRRTPVRAHALRSDEDIHLAIDGDTVSLTVPETGLFETVVIEYGEL
ncbi:hypothetical protein ACFFKE_30300 [Streptomyces mutabilis]|uniref:hypothetical protein n=1 Tax=Streptomyces mutabilis TaxID=67332 RepID=UPI00177F9855|nr:hypothetical protein [Streptomyces mutabilis]GGQ33253.1 hypothetical protein GCM10010279_47080 [Streptomyces mutabilis]